MVLHAAMAVAASRERYIRRDKAKPPIAALVAYHTVLLGNATHKSPRARFLPSVHFILPQTYYPG